MNDESSHIPGQTSSDSSDNTMIFGMKVKVQRNEKKAKTYLSVGLVCMILSIFFHITQAAFQSVGVGNFQPGGMMALTVEAWHRTSSSLSFLSLWLAILMLYHSAFQHRKALQEL